MPTETARRQRAAARDAARNAFQADVLAGLRATPRALPCKWFYDQRGSELFDRICVLPEYYPTRTERLIVQTHADDIADAIGPGVALVEYGSGSSTKTRVLLDALDRPVAYLPVDISADHLRRVGRDLASAYPAIDVLPIAADFTRPFALPPWPRDPSHVAVYFPGSTIGNFEPAAAVELLASVAELVGSGGGLVIGIDLQKDPAVIEAAYNDAAGVTAAFNKNLLVRINRELDGDFDLASWDHRAEYNRDLGRVEISLVSQHEQTVRVGEQAFRFTTGEAIHTEHSHKYTIDGFAEMAGRVGFELHATWTDPREWFGVLHLVVA